MRPTGRARSRFLLANQILAYICEHRIVRDRHLVETALAERLAVSRTLVRAALKLLAAQGVVEPRPNQGFFLLRGWEEIDANSVEVPPSAEDDLYLAIVRDRLDGTMPDRITQVALLERYRADRGVLLRTLSRLGDEGIVAKNRGHGWTFSPTIDTAQALRASYDFRRILEPAGILLDSFGSDAAMLGRMRDAHLTILEGTADASGRRLFEIDAEFHETLAAFSRNAFFVQAIQQQNRMRRLLEYRGYSNRRRIRDWVLEHVAIIDALLAGKREQAAEGMRAHLGNAHRAAGRPDASEPEAAPNAARHALSAAGGA